MKKVLRSVMISLLHSLFIKFTQADEEKEGKVINYLSFISVAVIKYHDQKQLGKESVCISLQLSGHGP